MPFVLRSALLSWNIVAVNMKITKNQAKTVKNYSQIEYCVILLLYSVFAVISIAHTIVRTKIVST